MLTGFMNGFRTATELCIEEAREKDLSAISDIHMQGFAQGWSDGEFAKLLARDGYACLVARRKGKPDDPIAGFVLFRVVADEAEIITIATRKSSRGKGVGARLMEAAIRKLQSDRIRSLFLEVDENNKSAVSLYRKLAFKQVGERKGYYPPAGAVGQKASTALVMQRELG